MMTTKKEVEMSDDVLVVTAMTKDEWIDSEEVEFEEASCSNCHGAGELEFMDNLGYSYYCECQACDGHGNRDEKNNVTYQSALERDIKRMQEWTGKKVITCSTRDVG